MKNKLLFILLLSLTNLFSFNDVDSIFNQSNNLYNSNSFEQAIDGYKSVLNKDINNGILYYNIGNCYYRLNNLGYARLFYEKAKLYNPTDRDVLHNIELVKAQLIDDIKNIPQFFLVKIINDINVKLNSSQWAYVVILALYLNLIFFLLFFFSKSVDTRVNSLRSVLITIPILLITVFFLIYSNFDNKYDTAVLVDSNAYVKTAPSIEADDYFIIHEGVKFQLIDEVDNWSRVLLSDGKDGWISNSTFLKIVK
tara:strand:- start:46 stop:804 length:759 start_codon:yes stop_codon:yes gene_type:complete